MLLFPGVGPLRSTQGLPRPPHSRAAPWHLTPPTHPPPAPPPHGRSLRARCCHPEPCCRDGGRGGCRAAASGCGSEAAGQAAAAAARLASWRRPRPSPRLLHASPGDHAAHAGLCGAAGSTAGDEGLPIDGACRPAPVPCMVVWLGPPPAPAPPRAAQPTPLPHAPQPAGLYPPLCPALRAPLLHA